MYMIFFDEGFIVKYHIFCCSIHHADGPHSRRECCHQLQRDPLADWGQSAVDVKQQPL